MLSWHFHLVITSRIPSVPNFLKPIKLFHLLWKKANERNISFETLDGGQFTGTLSAQLIKQEVSYSTDYLTHVHWYPRTPSSHCKLLYNLSFCKHEFWVQYQSVHHWKLHFTFPNCSMLHASLRENVQFQRKWFCNVIGSVPQSSHVTERCSERARTSAKMSVAFLFSVLPVDFCSPSSSSSSLSSSNLLWIFWLPNMDLKFFFKHLS